jgi:hypothetical protein
MLMRDYLWEPSASWRHHAASVTSQSSSGVWGDIGHAVCLVCIVLSCLVLSCLVFVSCLVCGVKWGDIGSVRRSRVRGAELASGVSALVQC